MEVWARVASHVPFSMLLDTFWSLTHAGLLPETHTHASNAFLQFCSEVPAAEGGGVITDDADGETRCIMLNMGFDPANVSRAMRVCRGNRIAVLEYLLA